MHRVDLNSRTGTGLRPTRIVAITEIPTPYRLPLYRKLAERDDLDLEVLFCAADEPDRPWRLDEELAGVPHRILPGRALTFRRGGNTFVYEFNPGIWRALRKARPDAIVIGGYSVFAEQAAIAYARATRTPYLLHCESHLLKTRPGWLRAAKRSVLPLVIGGAAAGLATGTAAAAYLEHYGIPEERIRLFPNTIDVGDYRRRSNAVRADAARIRAERGLPDRFWLFAGRLVEAKGIPELISAIAELGADAPPVLVAGDGPLLAALRSVPGLVPVGFQQAEQLLELFSLAELTLVPSRVEPWGVVVNEALACGSPVIASDAVGAAVDLIVDGTNGRIFTAGDSAALAAALRKPVPTGDPRAGRIATFGYEFAEEQFLEAIAIAIATTGKDRR